MATGRMALGQGGGLGCLEKKRIDKKMEIAKKIYFL